ncbi:MAG: leucyl/phenylalanyl-tRNA--protein transferase [Gammaproteobacteria bacterium]|nr:leucyl/phenylalanyl-tRNA--protein transferase [Gammaproteobacteria bacterium]
MIHVLDPYKPNEPFPPVDLAEQEPNGLLAVGGDLSSTRLLNAYRSGIFPWYSDNQPILWWSPNPRTVLYPEKLKISRSLGKTLRNKPFKVTFDRTFTRVMAACSAPRKNEDGTWITSEMVTAYRELHRIGFAHSVEVWLEDQLVGGLYGVALGSVFFGESMFSIERDASKVALVYLARLLKERDYQLIDCQVYSAHLISLGAEEIDRARFCQELNHWCQDREPFNLETAVEREKER